MALWGGRFAQGPEDSVFALSRSVHFDWRLAPYDLRSSMAHLAILNKSGLIAPKDAEAILKALKELATEVSNGSFVAIDTDEDVHSALERGLTEKLGAVGGSLRAGRSRNDQVTTDLRLFAIDHMLEIATLVTALQTAILEKAAEYFNDPAPGFTHIQHAQPVSFGHELAKHAHAFARDLDRINDWLSRTSVSSLGAGALAGSSLALEPAFTAKNLGFESTFANSIDAVSDRDYVAEALFIFAMIGNHLSRIGEEWTLWSSQEFAWAKVADAYSTGSSIMPQKKNPDVPELVRGKSGRVFGDLMSLLTLMKGQPLAYNKDNQEDKEPLFDAIDTLQGCLLAFADMIPALVPNVAVMREAAFRGFSTATDLADYLVKKGLPFRDAHEVVGKAVALGVSKSCDLSELDLAELQGFSDLITDDVYQVLTLDGSVAARNHIGGTAPNQVRAAVERARTRITALTLAAGVPA